MFLVCAGGYGKKGLGAVKSGVRWRRAPLVDSLTAYSFVSLCATWHGGVVGIPWLSGIGDSFLL